MNADQIAEIRPAMREAIAGAPMTCVTLRVEGADERWVQFIDHTINAAYPHADDPTLRIETLSALAGPTLVAWDAGMFAAFEFANVDPTHLAKWIDAYFVGVLGCPAGEYHVCAAFEQM